MNRKHLLLCLLFVSFSLLAKETLPCEAIYGTKPEIQSKSAWNLSNIKSNNPTAASYIIYGDTLLSETIDGIRRWYALDKEGKFFVREESDSFFIVPDTAMSCVAPLEASFAASGLVDNLFPMSRRGSHVCKGPFEGYIVISTGDTIPAKMAVEIFTYEEKVSPTFDGFKPDDTPKSYSHGSTELYRWYISDRLLPVAVRSISSNGKGVNKDITYVYDFSDGIPDYEALQQEVIKKVFDKAVIQAAGENVRITLNAPFPISLNVDIMTNSGISYHHSEHAIDGNGTIEISIGQLPPGNFICAISCGEVFEKRLLTK